MHFEGEKSKMRTAQVSIVLLALTLPLSGQEGKSSRPSPAATAKLNLGGKEVSVAYSQPKIRDPKTGEQRKIFGGLVPYGKIWRTGANEATTLKTEVGLDIGGSKSESGHGPLRHMRHVAVDLFIYP